MADLKHILVVDDHFEMLEFLRSMLEMANANYRVLGVPSAEEGLLELKRRSRQGDPFDLLITDVRLAGMSGFELARKVRDLRAEMPIIIITAYASVQGRKEAELLGVRRYFEKPLDTDALLASVHSALYAEGHAPPAVTRPASRTESPKQEVAPDRQAVEPAVERSIALRRRLQALLSDTGAVQALLCDRQGRVRFRVGADTDQPLERVAKVLARTIGHSFELAAELGSAQPFTIQYQAGEHVDLYTANIARHAFLILLFDARARRGRIGTVWIFAQRAIKDLLELIPEKENQGGGRETGTSELKPASPMPASDKRGGQQSRQAASDEEKAASPPPASSAAVEEVGGDEALLDLLERAADVDGDDLDAFWDEATADAGRGSMRGLSFEEAVQRGLLPPELGG